MSKELQIIRALYDESPDRAEIRQALNDDPAFREEYQSLSEVKFHLDHRRRSRPDSHVIDSVVAAASSKVPAEQSMRHPDRPSRPGRARRSVRFHLAGGVLTALLIAGIGLWHLSPLTVEMSPVAEESSSAVEQVEATGRLESQQKAMSAPASSSIADVLQDYEADAASTDLSWDTGSEVRELHRRIEMLQVRSGSLDWGEPVVPLETAARQVAPGSDRWQGLQPAYQGDK